MKGKSDKIIRLLLIYSVASNLIFIALLLFSFKNKETTTFDEINVKRINVLAEDSSLRMVISNEERQHPGRINGEDISPRKRPAGILFFNEEGDGSGGLISWGKRENGNGQSGMSFTMDQYHNDQVVQILNDESYKNGKPSATRGIAVNDIPFNANLGETMSKYRTLLKISDSTERNQKIEQLLKKEGMKNRMFIGKKKDGKYGLFLCDKEGRVRFRLYVDSLGNPFMQTLDSSGTANNVILN